MKGLDQVNMGPVLQVWINSVHFDGKPGFAVDKIIFPHDIVVSLNKGAYTESRAVSSRRMRFTSRLSACSRENISLLSPMVSSGSINEVLRLSLSPCRIPFTCRLCSANRATTRRPFRNASSVSATKPALLSLATIRSNTRRSSLRFLYKDIRISASSGDALSRTWPFSSRISSINWIMAFS